MVANGKSLDELILFYNYFFNILWTLFLFFFFFFGVNKYIIV